MKIVEKTDKNRIYSKPKLLNDNVMHYCPGCGHAVVTKLVAEVLGEMDVDVEDIIGVSPVGCGVFIYNYIDIDWVEAAHGRAPAVATGVKRLNPEKLVFTYQGDGEVGAIGTGEAVHACSRGENITIIFINNAVYGMTSGQMAPTTPLGMKTTTCPDGRQPELNGYPLRIAEMFSCLDGTCYVTRQAVNTYKAVKSAKKALRKAFDNSMKGKGTSVVEIVSACPSNWKMTPVEANKWLSDNLFKTFRLGDIKDI